MNRVHGYVRRTTVALSALAIVCAGSVLPVMADESAAPEFSFSINEFHVVGQLPFSSAKVDGILSPFIGEHDGIEGLQAAADALESELRSAGYAFFEVSLPPQTLRSGTVTLEVVQQRIGQVGIEGRSLYSEQNVLRTVPSLQPGLPPNTHRISRSVNLVNEGTSKKVKVSFANGQRPGEIDATIKVTELRPWNVFTSISNTGTEQTNEWRATLGYQYSNLFDRDHSVALAYTTAPEDPADVTQLALNYRWPFYGHGGSLNFYYTHSDIDPGIVDLEVEGFDGAFDFELKGAGEAYGLRYIKPLLNRGRLKQTLSLALDNKLFEDDSRVVGSAPNDIPDRRSTPLVLGYDIAYRQGRAQFSAGLQYARNLELGSNNDDAVYIGQAPRDQRRADWDWIRYRAGVDWGFGQGWIWRALFNGQQGGQQLISGEQFGIGGANSVRGYDERVALGDNGYQATTELWFPAFSKAKVRTLVFYDLGEVSQEDVADSVDTELSGWGIGGRWSYKQSFTLRLDVAQALEDLNTTESGDIKAHVNLFWRI